MLWWIDKYKVTVIRHEARTLTRFEWPAESKGVAGHVPRAGADGGETAEVAVGVDAARVGAGVDASVVHAHRLVARTLAVGLALRGADAVRIAEVALDAPSSITGCGNLTRRTGRDGEQNTESTFELALLLLILDMVICAFLHLISVR